MKLEKSSVRYLTGTGAICLLIWAVLRPQTGALDPSPVSQTARTLGLEFATVGLAPVEPIRSAASEEGFTLEQQSPRIAHTKREISGLEFLHLFAHDPEGMGELQMHYTAWERQNWPLAQKIAAMAAERGRDGHNENAESAKEEWTLSELREASAWITALTEGETQFSLLAELGKLLFPIDSERAIELVEVFQRPMYREGYIVELATAWAARDPARASEWIERFPAGEMRDRLQMRVAIACAEQLPAAAAEYVAALEPGETRDSAARTVTRQWAATDPRAAAEWASSYPADELRYELLSTAVAYWDRKDQRALVGWIQENPSDPFRAAAAELLTRSHAAREAGGAGG